MPSYPVSNAVVDEQGRISCIPAVLDDYELGLKFEGDANLWGHEWERLSFIVRPGESITELARRLYSERSFDAWIDKLDQEPRQVTSG